MHVRHVEAVPFALARKKNAIRSATTDATFRPEAFMVSISVWLNPARRVTLRPTMRIGTPQSNTAQAPSGSQ
jgi:hypothetical protein